MKKYLFFLGVIFCVESCTSRPKQEFVLLEPLKHLVDSFVTANPGQKVYELYIDKVFTDSSIIILQAGKSSLAYDNRYFKQTPTIQILSNGQKVDVYSGVERYIKNIELNYDTSKWGPITGDYTCLIFDIKGNLFVSKNIEGSSPFFTLPVAYKLKYTAPTIKDSGTY